LKDSNQDLFVYDVAIIVSYRNKCGSIGSKYDQEMILQEHFSRKKKNKDRKKDQKNGINKRKKK